MNFGLEPNLALREYKNFHVNTLTIDSTVLEGNGWKDPTCRRHPLLISKKPTQKLIFVLSGFTGNGPKSFNERFGESHLPSEIDQWVSSKKIPIAHFVFVDAITFLGGSQFINSRGMGRYEDHIVQEIIPALQTHFEWKNWPNHSVAVLGGSSGGYGALSLASQYPQKFSWCLALAPDSFFEASLLPDLRAAQALADSMGGFKKLLALHKSGHLLRRRDGHQILNGIAMAFCYGEIIKGEPVWPLDHRGQIIAKTWKKWLALDPLYFLKKRRSQLKKLKGIYLDVGDVDSFHLQYGARQLRSILKGTRFTYSEFSGGHFELGQRRLPALQYLKRKGF